MDEGDLRVHMFGTYKGDEDDAPPPGTPRVLSFFSAPLFSLPLPSPFPLIFPFFPPFPSLTVPVPSPSPLLSSISLISLLVSSDVRYAWTMRAFMILSGHSKEVALSLDNEGQLIAHLSWNGFRPESEDPLDQ